MTKVTLDRLDERVRQHGEEIIEIKDDIRFMRNDLSDIKNILTNGDGKIKRNFMLIKQIEEQQKGMFGKILGIVTIITGIIGSAIGYIFHKLG